VRAQLFDIDVERKRQIDDAIDYFGGHGEIARENSPRRTRGGSLEETSHD